MSQSHARLFEKWLAAGDERTFGEWLAYRRATVTHRRQQAKMARHFGPLMQQASAQQMALLQAGMQGVPMRGPLHFAPPGGLGGLFGGLVG